MTVVMMGWAKQAVVVCGDESLGSEPPSLHYCQGHIIFCGTGERNQEYTENLEIFMNHFLAY